VNHLPDVEPVLRAYLADTGDRAPDRVLVDVAARIARQPRRAWRLRGRPFMNLYAKAAAGLAAALLVVVVGYNLLPKGPSFGSQPTLAPTPTPTAAPTQPPSPTLGSGALPNGRLAAGHYTITLPTDMFPGITIAADIPAGWTGYPEIPALTSPSDSEGARVGGLIGFMPGEGLFSDACHWNVDGTGATDQPGDVVVGPTVQDLVQALRANTSYTSSAPTPITIGRFQGSVLELQLPGQDVLSTCDGEPDQTGDHKFIVLTKGFWSQGPDSRWRLYILDVDGTRLVTMISSFGSIPQAELDAAKAIVESFEITP
jgi:hypothetical protein